MRQGCPSTCTNHRHQRLTCLVPPSRLTLFEHSKEALTGFSPLHPPETFFLQGVNELLKQI